MKKNKTKYLKKKTLKINEKNNIDSIIEIFQKFTNKYNIITTTLEPNIQYQTRHIKITQTYSTTLLENNITHMTEQLKNKGSLILLIIDDLKYKNNEVNNKINEINKIKNVKTIKIKEEDTYQVLDKILSRKIK